MSRIAWSRYSGDDIEAFAAMCICRERPTARRIRPSRGDGGIDVYVPLGDGHVDVYQVKKFAENLKSGQLAQIKKSYEGIKTYAAKRGWTIDMWHLVMPLNPTPENNAWFDALNSDDPFEATWDGSDVFDNWAADYPKVVDYYLEGSANLLAQELARFHATTRITLPEVDPEVALSAFRGLEPAGVLDRIALLNTTLNDADPHFLYDFAVGTAPTPAPRLGDGYPAHVATVSNEIDGRILTVHILARCAESLYERPLTHKGTIVVETGSAEEREWKKFLEYGLAPSHPLKVREFVTDLPGGLGGTTDEGLIFISEPENLDAEYERMISVLSPEGNSLAELKIRFSGPRSNHDGTGFSTRGTDPSGILAVEILSKKREAGWDLTFNFALNDVAGHYVTEAAHAVAFLHHFTAPNSMRLADPRIPRKHYDRLIPVHKPDNGETRAASIRHRFVQALATIQQYADIALKIPDFESIGPDEAVEIIRTGSLLREGAVTVTWEKLTLTLSQDAPELDGPQALRAELPLQITIGGSMIHLGRMRADYEAGEVAERQVNPDGYTTVVVRPALGKTTAVLVWAGPDSISE